MVFEVKQQMNKKHRLVLVSSTLPKNPTKKPWKNGGWEKIFYFWDEFLAYFQRDFLATGAKGDVENS